jgi:hypothetical protein
MKETFLRQRNHHHNKLIALFFIIVAAVLVGYLAWQSSQVIDDFTVVTENSDQVQYAVDLGTIYFSAASANEPDSWVTYKYGIKKNKKTMLFDYPYHSSLSPVDSQSAIVTMLDNDTSASSSVADVFRPAYIDFVSSEFSYLDTPTGIDEQHYRVAPIPNAPVAYMQLTASDGSDNDQMDIASWEVVVHYPATEQTSASNTIIPAAAYPEWQAEGLLTLLREEGVVGYDLTTAEESLIELPYTNYSMANQYLVSLANVETPEILLLASGENQFTVLSGQLDENDFLQTSFKYEVTETNTVFVNAVLSPDQTMFAVLALTTYPQTEEGTGRVGGEVRLYSFANPDLIRRLPVDFDGPENVTLLSWQ